MSRRLPVWLTLAAGALIALWLLGQASHARAQGLPGAVTPDASLSDPAATAPLSPCSYKAVSSRTPSGHGPALYCAVCGGDPVIGGLKLDGVWLEINTAWGCPAGTVTHLTLRDGHSTAEASEAGRGSDSMIKIDGTPAGTAMDLTFQDWTCDGNYPAVASNGMQCLRDGRGDGNTLYSGLDIHDLGGRPISGPWGIANQTPTSGHDRFVFSDSVIENACLGYANTGAGDHCEVNEFGAAGPIHASLVEYRGITCDQSDAAPYASWTACIWPGSGQTKYPVSVDAGEILDSTVTAAATTAGKPAMGRAIGLAGTRWAKLLVAGNVLQAGYYCIGQDGSTVGSVTLWGNVSALTGQPITSGVTSKTGPC